MCRIGNITQGNGEKIISQVANRGIEAYLVREKSIDNMDLVYYSQTFSGSNIGALVARLYMTKANTRSIVEH